MEGAYILPRIASLDKPLRLAVLISGSGSGLEALLNYQNTPRSHDTKPVSYTHLTLPTKLEV